MSEAHPEIGELRGEIAYLKGQVDALTKLVERLFHRNEGAPLPYPLPVPQVQAGCVCPIGAELNCGSSGCPRRSYFKPFTTCSEVSRTS